VEGGFSSGDCSSIDETGDTMGEISPWDGLIVTPADSRTLHIVEDIGYFGGAAGGPLVGGLLSSKMATKLSHFGSSFLPTFLDDLGFGDIILFFVLQLLIELIPQYAEY
jgi:hypothetical protein